MAYFHDAGTCPCDPCRVERAAARILELEQANAALEAEIAALRAQLDVTQGMVSATRKCLLSHMGYLSVHGFNLVEESVLIDDTAQASQQHDDRIRAEERERCAKLMEGKPEGWESADHPFCRLIEHVQGLCECDERAKAIRALADPAVVAVLERLTSGSGWDSGSASESE